MKKIFLSGLVLLASVAPAFAAGSLRDGMVLNAGTAVSENTAISTTTLFSTAERYMLGIVTMIAILVFLWVGYELLSSEGDPERLKKAYRTLAYAALGLALVPASYAIVKLVLSINF